MGFPVPGDAIEPSLDLNRHLITNPAATFILRVEGDLVTDAETHPGDLLIIDRSKPPQTGALVVAAIAGSLQVLRLEDPAPAMDLWGVVTHLIRQV